MTREQRLALFVEKFLELANDLGDTLSPDRTFRISQAGQSGSVQAALASSALRASVPNPSLRNLLRKYQDILNRREEIDRIFAMQASLTTAEQEGPSILQLDKEIQLLETARATAKERIRTEFPNVERLTANRPLSVDEARALLNPGEAVVLIRALHDKSYVWALSGNGDIVSATSDHGLDDIEWDVVALRSAVEPGSIRYLRDIPPFDVEVAYNLYRKLLEPVRSVWGPAKSLLIVADGALQQLPLSLLVTEPQTQPDDQALPFDGYREVAWLARTHAITVLPSLNALAALSSPLIKWLFPALTPR